MSTTMAIPAVTSSGQTVLILKEGSSQNRGKEAQRNNIAAAKLIAEIVKTSLGPRGMDKMLVDSLGDVTITNDGATMLKEIDVQHPAAKMLVEVSKTTDNEVGDGTTSAVVLAGALLEKAEKEAHKPGDHERLQEVQVALDRYWDLLRQRRARREFGRDPDEAHVRPTKTVEGYVQ